MKKHITSKKPTTLRSKISRKMTLQVCLIAAVAILSICFTSVVLEQFLVREALKREANHFWTNYERDPTFQPPNTDNLKGYLTYSTMKDGVAAVPKALSGYPLGFKKIDGATAHSLLYNCEKFGVTSSCVMVWYFSAYYYFGIDLPNCVVGLSRIDSSFESYCLVGE